MDHERFFRPSESKYTLEEAAALAQVEVDFARAIFRAVGTPEHDADDRYLDDQDVEGIVSLGQLHQMGTPMLEMVAISRAYGYAMSTLADAEAGIFRRYFVEPMIAGGVNPEDVESLVDGVLNALLKLTDVPMHNARRLHLSAALKDAAAAASNGPGTRLAVGFADLVDYSRLSASLGGDDLSRLVARFEELVQGACIQARVRVVKMIGDAVMLVSSEPDRALAAVNAVVVGARSDPTLPAARAGLDVGEVVPLAGDYFGTPVNTAARIAAFAPPDAVVASEAFLAACTNRPDGDPLGRHALRGVGEVDVVQIRDLL